MIMLSDKVKKKEVQNWMKGVLAITKTTEVLRSAIRNGFDQFISKLSDDEKKHLETFYQCLKNNGVEYFKTQTKRKKYWECPHHLCQTLMGRLLDNFENGSHKSIWEFNITQPAESEDYEESEDKLSKAIQTVELGGKWMLMKLFMFGEMKDVPRMSLEELDLSQTIKLMRSCKLFTDIDGSVPALEKALDKRNQLMHSKDNEINDEETINIFKELEDLVTVFADKTTSYEIDAVEDLHKLRDKKDLIECEDTTKYKELFREVLTIKEKALKLDISVNKNLHEESKTHSEELVQMLNVATAENKLIDVELTLDRSEQSDFEMQEKVREMTERARKMDQKYKEVKEEAELKQAKLWTLETDVAEKKKSVSKINARINKMKKQDEKYCEEEKLQQARLQELELNVAMKKQDEKYCEEEKLQQAPLQELELNVAMKKQDEKYCEEEKLQQVPLQELELNVTATIQHEELRKEEQQQAKLQKLETKDDTTKQHEELRKEERQQARLQEVETKTDATIQHEELRKEEQQQAKLQKLETKADTTKQHEELRKEERQQAQLQELETKTDATIQHEELRKEEQQQAKLQKLETKADYKTQRDCVVETRVEKKITSDENDECDHDAYKTQRDGVVETRVEKKITSDENDECDHDALLRAAIQEVILMNQDLVLVKLWCMRQTEELNGN